MSIILGLDIGGSTTKISGHRTNGELLGAIQVKAADQLTSSYGALGRFLTEFDLMLNDIQKICVTGVGASRIKNNIYGIKTAHINEFTCVARGGQSLSGHDRILVANMGTGTAFVRADKKNVTHLGGTGVGGGTLAGLCQYLYNITSFETIIETAAKGSLDKTDLTIKDICISETPALPPHITAANFGKLSNSATKEDITLGLINTIFQTVGVMASLSLRNDDIKTIVLTGALTELPQAKVTFGAMHGLTGYDFIMPINAIFATAIGAALEGINEA